MPTGPDTSEQIGVSLSGPEAVNLPTPMRQVTAPDEVDAEAIVRTLLDKVVEGEQSAGETEIK